MRRLGWFLLIVIGGLALAIASGWGILVLRFAGPGGETVRSTVAGLYALIGLVALGAYAFHRARRPAAITLVLAFAAVVVWWSTLSPSNQREWQPEVAVLPYATVAGDLVTMHNIRNFDYRTETDFRPAYYDRTFDLRKLQAVDLFAVYWMGPAIAHIFVSFDFEGQHLAVSIEARKENGEGYSAIRGFFRQYELVYVVADERDVVRVRTNYRKDPPEDVYLYRVRGPVDNARRFFLDYVREINALHEKAAFYNALTTNCTTVIFAHSRVNPGHVPFSWKILLSGYVPEYLYEHGRFLGSGSFEELRRRSHINTVAQAADRAADFSTRIRAHLPR